MRFSSYLSGFIPDNYIEDDLLRLNFYRRLNSVFSVSDIDVLRNEVVNRFGAIPSDFLLLFDEFVIRVVSANLFLSGVVINKDSLIISFEVGFWGGLADKLLKFIESFVVLHGLEYNYVNKSGGSSLRLLFKGSKLLYRNVLDFLDGLEKII